MGSIIKVNEYKDFNNNDIMTSDGSGNVTIDNITTINAAAMKNTPAFMVRIGSSQNITTATWTKIDFDTEVYDTDSKFDTSNNKFTPGVAGKYYIQGSIKITNDAAGHLRDVGIAIKKNGSFFAVNNKDSPSGDTSDYAFISILTDANTTDYYELWAYGETGSGSMVIDGTTSYRQVWFGANKLNT